MITVCLCVATAHTTPVKEVENVTVEEEREEEERKEEEEEQKQEEEQEEEQEKQEEQEEKGEGSRETRGVDVEGDNDDVPEDMLVTTPSIHSSPLQKSKAACSKNISKKSKST